MFLAVTRNLTNKNDAAGIINNLYVYNAHMQSSCQCEMFLLGEEEACFSSFVLLFDTQLLDALEVNRGRARPAGAKAGHRTKQIHPWNCWVDAFESAYVLVTLDPEKYRVLI